MAFPDLELDLSKVTLLSPRQPFPDKVEEVMPLVAADVHAFIIMVFSLMLVLTLKSHGIQEQTQI